MKNVDPTTSTVVAPPSPLLASVDNQKTSQGGGSLPQKKVRQPKPVHDKNAHTIHPLSADHKRILDLERQVQKQQRRINHLLHLLTVNRAKNADISHASNIPHALPPPGKDTSHKKLSDEDYAMQTDLPRRTNPLKWKGRGRYCSYDTAFRESFVKLSRQHQKQTRARLKKFAEEGPSKNAEKIEVSRGWVSPIPYGVKGYLYERISDFLRFAYNLLGNDHLIIYTVGKKSDR